MIEQVIGLLNRQKIDDAKVITYTRSMISVAQEPMKEYCIFLEMIYSDPEIKNRAINGTQLSAYERKLLNEMMRSNLGEYLDALKCNKAIELED